MHSQVGLTGTAYADRRIDCRGGRVDYAYVETLGAILRTAREVRGLTRRAVDQETGLAEGNLYRWENGVNPDPVPLLKLLAFYGLSPASMLRRMDETVPERYAFEQPQTIVSPKGEVEVNPELEAAAEALGDHLADLGNGRRAAGEEPPDENQGDPGRRGRAG